MIQIFSLSDGGDWGETIIKDYVRH